MEEIEVHREKKPDLQQVTDKLYHIILYQIHLALSIKIVVLLLYIKYLSSPPVFSGVRVTRSLVVYVCFIDRCLTFCTFSFGHCIVCPSIYSFWLPLWYLQTLLSYNNQYLWHENLAKLACNFKFKYSNTNVTICSCFYYNCSIICLDRLS